MLANRLLACTFALAVPCAWAVPITFNLAPAFGAAGDPAPFVTLDVDGATAVGSSFSYVQTGDVYDFAGAVQFKGTNARDISSISFAGSIDKDPYINWAVSAVTASNSVTFTYVFGTPVVPGIYYGARAGFSGSMGDLRGDGVSATNIENKSEIPMGTGIPALTLSGNCVAGPSVPASNHPCPAVGQYGPIFANLPDGNYPSMSSSLKFTLTPNDSASFQGQLILLETPEPGTIGLMAFGLLSVAFGRYRMVRARKSHA